MMRVSKATLSVYECGNCNGHWELTNAADDLEVYCPYCGWNDKYDNNESGITLSQVKKQHVDTINARTAKPIFDEEEKVQECAEGEWYNPITNKCMPA